MTHYSPGNFQNKIWTIKEKSFENTVIEALEDAQLVFTDVDSRINMLEGSSTTTLQAEIDLLRGEIENLRTELAQTKNDLSFEATARTMEVEGLYEKLKGCSWCSTGQLGASVP